MKARIHMGFDEKGLVQELKMFTENDGDIYRQTTTSILRNLATKKASGKYDGKLAVVAFMYLAEAGAKKYVAAFGGGAWHETFPMAIRRKAAEEWRDEFETEYNYGNYDNLLPKKYQKQPISKNADHAHNVGDEVWWWGSQGGKVIGTVEEIYFRGERPDYVVKIHGAGSIVMKAEHELASETGRKKLARKTRASDRRKR
jgi:hypothetical protein